jgi:non-specific serine/threonine protein kinase
MLEPISFGTWLRQRRRALDLTQKAFADRVGCAEITVRRMEADEYKPSNELALVLFEKLGIPELERPEWVRFARGLAEVPKNQTHPSPSREPNTNLPIPLTSFIGREKEVQGIRKRLEGYRLVTLVGAGGIGKTRLAQEVVHPLLSSYTNGVWLVELASLTDSALVQQSVASVFHIQQGTNSTELMEPLIRFLRAKTMLLILDNCEHVLDACARLANELLKNCPHLKILATGREALGILGEALYLVPSLTIPNIQRISTLDTWDDYESIRLFAERAQLVQMHFAVTKENASSVAQVCSRLDGIPLAIELAAVRVQMFTVEQIADRLDQCFQILTGGSHTALPKHQTLWACIDWSWQLLNSAEQTLLCRLSVFAGGFTLEAAQQSCTGNGIEVGQVFELILQLIAKSLVDIQVGPGFEYRDMGRERRYRLLEPIRQFAHEKLVETGEEEMIRTQHLKYFRELCKQAEPALRSHEQLEWYARLTHEHDNIRAALDWAKKKDVEAGLSISGSLWRFWEDIDLREGEHWLEKLLSKPESHNHPEARAKALYAYGIILFLTEQYTRMRGIVEECLSLYQSLGDRRGEADGLIVTGRYRFATNDIVQAHELARRALALSEALGDVWRQAFMLGHLGWSSGNDYRQQISYFKKAVSLFREAGDFRELQEYLGTLGNYELTGGDIQSAQKHIAEAMQLSQNPYFKGAMHYLVPLGRLEAIQGNFEQAHALLEKSITNAIELGNRNDYLWDRAQLGHIIVQEGQSSGAGEIFFETAQGFRNDRNIVGVCYSLEGMAGVYVLTDKPAVAARLLGWADITRKEINDIRPRLEQAEVDKIIEACLAKMGEAAFSDAYDEGQRMTLDEAVAYALEDK